MAPSRTSSVVTAVMPAAASSPVMNEEGPAASNDEMSSNEPPPPSNAASMAASGVPVEELSAGGSVAMSATLISNTSTVAPSSAPVPMEEMGAEGSSTALAAAGLSSLPGASRLGSRAVTSPIPTSAPVAAGGEGASGRAIALSRGTPAVSFPPPGRDRAALWAPVRDALRDLSSSDLRRLRFGANRHRYHLRAPLSEARLVALEATAGISLPEDYRDFLLEMGDGGAGPYYGLVPFDQPAQQDLATGPFSAPATNEGAWHGAVLLCHLGCGYLVYLVVEGAHRGEVWLDLGTSGPPAKIAPHFIAFYTEWLTSLQRAEWPAVHVRPGSCALALALSAYLGHVERQLGKQEGALSEVELRAALTSLGPGAIQIAAETKSFPPVAAAEPQVDPCLACERMLQELSGLGLRRDVIAPGAPVGFPDLLDEG